MRLDDRGTETFDHALKFSLQAITDPLNLLTSPLFDMTFVTKTRNTFLLASILFVSGTASAQNWIDMGPFPPDGSVTLSTHGIAVDAEGKVWIDQFVKTIALDMNGDTLRDASGNPFESGPIHVYNPDGTLAMNPIHILGDDTLGTFPDNPFVGGMKTDPDGNVIVALRHPSLDGLLYRLNHQTGEVMDRFVTTGYSLASPGIDSRGNFYYANVGAPGSGIGISDPSFTFLGLVTDTVKFGIGRNLEVSADGNTVYWANSVATQVPGLIKFTRPDEFSPYSTSFSSDPDTTGIVHPGLTSESSTRHPTTGHVWFGHAKDCCGSAADSTKYTFLSWYGIDPATDEIVDSLNFNLPIPYTNENTRAIGFSSDGQLAYVGLFATSGQPTVKKFMRSDATSIQRDPVEIPDGFTLSQNYPNPFNPQTKIEFEMKDGGFATLKVYDVLGREVATLVDEHLVAGKYTATFNAANTLSSGTYVYQLDVAGHRLSGKMTLVK